MQPEKKTLQTTSLDNLVFLDIETTGLDCSGGAKIVEIAMLKINGATEEKFETLINPGSPIPLECSKIHSIYDADVANAPDIKTVAKDIADFISGYTVVCHNAGFDLAFVSKELKESGIDLQTIPYIDTLKLARQYFSFDSNALGNIANAIGVEVEVKHRAMADVLTMYSIAKYLFKNMYRKGVDLIEIQEYR